MDQICEFMKSEVMQKTILSATEKGVPVRIGFLFAKWVPENDPICNTSDLQTRIIQIEELISTAFPHLHEDTDWSVYHREYNILQVRFLHAADIKFLSKDPINLEVVVTN